MRRVHITSTAAVEKKYPEFEGVLYKARDAPEKGELTLNSSELQNLNVVGEPIYVEHDEKMGKVGVIVRCSFEPPNFLITGCINTENEQLRNSIRQQLKSGNLSDLSIGFSALQCTATGKFMDKKFNEASLVKKGFYEGTNIVRVCASGKGIFYFLRKKKFVFNARPPQTNYKKQWTILSNNNNKNKSRK